MDVGSSPTDALRKAVASTHILRYHNPEEVTIQCDSSQYGLDAVLMQLQKIIHQGWPGNKFDVPDAVRAYYDIRDEMTTQDQLVFKGPTVVTPTVLRKEMMAVCHSTHIGIDGCIRRARESMFWPRMSSELLKEYVSKCDVCMAGDPPTG